VTSQQDPIGKKIREEANRRLHPRTPATERVATVSGLVLCLTVIGDRIGGPWSDWVVWPACLGLSALWVGHEFGAREAWRLHEKALSSGARQVARQCRRDALARELFGRGYLAVAYFGGFDVLRQGGHWLLLLIFAAGAVYLAALALLIARVEWHMRAALDD
jgi:hypothetical protein